jgi:hypothetical protein
VFDTWAYNVLYYGPDVTLTKRLLSAFVPFNLLARHYPQVLLALLAAFAMQLFRLVQLRATPEEKAGRPWLFYLSVWDLTSLAGAISGGRAFEHYYVQCLPAFALSAACLLASAGAFARRRWLGQIRPSLPANAAAVLAALLVTITGLSLFTGPLSHRAHVEYPRDSAMSASRFIHALTTPAERIFVWGYNPDIYLYTDRKPASRYVYCSFQTGLIPWTNIEPDKDTAYAIVPGAMDALLADLRKWHPVFFVDCSPGQDRNFSKYPVAKFARLEAFVTENYLEVESAQFVPEGFRLHLITDRARLSPVRLAGGTAGRPEAPKIFGPALAGTVPTPVLIEADDPDGRLQHLELRAGDTLIDSVSFQPTHGITVQFVLPFDRLKPGPYRLVARAVSANGATHDSPEFAIASAASAVTRDQLPKYGLPCVTTTLMPLTVRAPFAPSVAPEDGHRVIALHAPSLLSFVLPADVRRVTGGFGIRPGAYAPENPYPTDGAEFFVDWVSKGEERHVLLHRWLQPRDHPEDRPIQFFSVEVPVHPAGGRLEFVITPGPYGRNASDWTFWTDLEAATSR